MKKYIFALILVILLAYFFYPEKEITFPPGVTAAEAPVQVNVPAGNIWTKGEYTIEALAEYRIKARVLSRNNFSMGKESDLSPFDLALGWGPMSDQSVTDNIKISQSNRWYEWYTENPPIALRDISLNSANVHIIPKDDTLEEQFDEVYKGSLVEMKGYLVKVSAADGWHWVSSLRRDDTAGGSCELMWVEELQILDNTSF